MKTKIKITFFTTFLFLGIFVNSNAQDKYEFAVVQLYFGIYTDLTVSINGETYEEELHIKETTLKSKYIGYDLSPALKKINEMQDAGWELYDQGTITFTYKSSYIFYMRKKKS